MRFQKTFFWLFYGIDVFRQPFAISSCLLLYITVVLLCPPQTSVLSELFSWKTRMSDQKNTKNTRKKAKKHGKNTSFLPKFLKIWPTLLFLLHFYFLYINIFKVEKIGNFFKKMWKNFGRKDNFFGKNFALTFWAKIFGIFWPKIGDFYKIL